MSEPILDPLYWARRLEAARNGELHHAIFRCPKARWERIEAKHRTILEQHVRFADSVLDVGCGWGRLLDLMPSVWHGAYCGLDLSPDFVKLGRQLHPQHTFAVADMSKLSRTAEPWWDWAVMISFRPMVKRNCGDEVWATIEANVRKMARKLLYLEYDEDDGGSIE